MVRFTDRACHIADDRDHGASELLEPLLALLHETLTVGPAATLHVARIVCEGQPAMAPLWNACAMAWSNYGRPGTFARTSAAMTRGREALVRAAGGALADVLRDVPSPRILTLSYSGSVARVLSSLTPQFSFAALCGESRPRFEGRRMAQQLATSGIHTAICTDAALTAHLSSATLVIFGADAIAATTWTNKVGSLGLAAAASLVGVPVFVVSGREKAQSAELAGRWRSTAGPAAEVWSDSPAGVDVLTPYFERIPNELVTQFLTDVGPITPLDIGQLAEQFAAPVSQLMQALSRS